MNQRGSVMVIDDDEPLRESVCDALGDAGYSAVSAPNGAAALQDLRAGAAKPDVILLDLMMPGMNGWQFREEQLRDPALADIPVVVMTASRDLRGLQVGEVLYKPITLDRLLAVVRRHSPPNGNGAAHQAASPVVNGDARGLFAGGGEMGRRMAELDWSRTPLGPVESWPQSLRTCVRIILTSRQPMFVWWGDELINIYNDAYRSIAGGKHPGALGQPARAVWREIWDQVGPRAETAMRAQEGTYDEALLLIMERHGYEEETYYTFSYSPVPSDHGGTGGIICANTDDTERIIGERQLVLLRELAARTADARSVKQVCQSAVAAFATNPRDLPFALLYVLEPGGASFRLAGTHGIAEGTPASPAAVAADDASCWDLSGALQAKEILLARDLADRCGPLPLGPWPRAPSQAALVRFAPSGQNSQPGVLVVGLNPYRLFDQGYRRFLDLASAQISAGLTSAQAYEQERERAEALAAIDRTKTAFFSNVSHEFRTPLTLMLGPVEDLLAGAVGPLTDDQRRQLEFLRRNGVRLQKLVNSLLDFSRLEAGRLQASYEPTDLSTMTRDLASAFRSAVERAGLVFEIDCPPLEEPIFVDREMWEKIVLNLLSNALKFTFQGKISISLRDRDGAVELKVADTGAGVPEEDLPRLFERFHRVEGQQARTYEGSGIGLALVQELAKLHGGRASAESTLGEGSTFTVTIPRGTDHLPWERLGAAREWVSTAVAPEVYVEEATRWSPAASAGVPAPQPPADAPRILLADDNADMRDYVRRLLEPHWRVEAVEDGAKALEAARARPPDLVLTDVMMPGLDGFALLRELRKADATRSVPVVMLSARAGEEAKVEGLTAGAEDYLAKPFSARELLARVRTHLELARLRKDIQARQDYLLKLFMQAPAAICVFRGPELVHEMANEHYARQVGGARDVVGKPLLEVLPELAGQGFDQLLQGVIQTRRPYVGTEMLARLARAPGGALEDTYWSFVYAPLEAPDGVERVLVLGNDVTEQVLARRQIEESEERFRRIVNQVQAGIAQLDLGGRITLTNERFREIVGRSAAELQQMRLTDLIHPDDAPEHGEELERLAASGAPFIAEVRYLKPDGSLIWVQSSVSRIDDRQGRAQGIASVAVDITQRKFAEAALRESESERAARLEQMEQALHFSETFVGMLGHDLRNPLSAIITAASLLLRREQGERIARPLQRIQTSAARMTRMIEQILDFTRTRIGGGIPIDPAPLDLRDLAEQMVQELEGASPQQITLESSGDTRGEWDSDRLGQVISNLLGNAVEHGDPHQPVRLTLDGRSPGEVRVSLWNAGAVPPALLSVIFDPFRRASSGTSSSRSRGLGLGLYIVQQVVQAHGGEIEVTSSAKQGTTFLITLPRAAGRTRRYSDASGRSRPSA